MAWLLFLLPRDSPAQHILSWAGFHEYYFRSLPLSGVDIHDCFVPDVVGALLVFGSVYCGRDLDFDLYGALPSVGMDSGKGCGRHRLYPKKDILHPGC